MAKTTAPQCFNLFKLPTITLRDGSHFTYTQILSQRGQSVILKLQGPYILRLFQSRDSVLAKHHYVDGYKELETMQVNDIAHITQEGNDWVIQDYVHVQMTLDQFFYQANKLEVKNPKKLKKMIEALEVFARSSARFEDFGDFHAEQLVWDGKSWQLLDWNHDHILADIRSTFTIFWGLEPYSPTSKKIIENMNQAILDERHHIFTNP